MPTALKKLADPGVDNHILYLQTERGDITYISPAGVDYFQIPSDEIIGKKEADLFGEHISFDLMEIDQRVLITGRPHHYQISQTTDTGEERVVVTKYLANVANGQSPQLVAVLQVKEDKHETEQPVTPLGQLFLGLQTATTAVSKSLDIDLITQTFTWEMTDLLQTDASAFYLWQEEQEQFFLQTVHDPNNNLTFEGILTQATYRFLRHAVEEQNLTQFKQQGTAQQQDEQRFLTKMGVSTILCVPLCTQGRLIGIVLICSIAASREFTITETAVAQLFADQTAATILNAQLYTELLKTNERLIESNGDLQAFAGTTAHDLKTPVGSIIGFSELLMQENNNFSAEEQHEFLSIILRSSHQMRDIIDNLLLLASVRQQGIPITVVEMDAIIPELLTRLAYLMKQNECEVIMPETWPACYGNAHWLLEVWANYMSNAIKYGGRPPIVELGVTVENNGYVRYWVKDNGKGLSPEEQAKLFVPFSRIRRKESSPNGHGLGLSIVQRIIQKLGGSVGIESKVGEGSTFYFALPQAPSMKNEYE